MKRTTSGNFRMLALLLAALAVMGPVADATFAQNQSVKPGINAPFENANVGTFRAIFESESRVIYRYRHAIVAILDLKQGMNVADVGAGTGLFTRLGATFVTERTGFGGRLAGD